MYPSGQTARAAAEGKGPQGQNRRQDLPCLPFPLGGTGKPGPPRLCQSSDGPAHTHHRVGHPGRVRQQQVQGKAAEGRCKMFHSVPPFVYCTVRRRVRVRSAVQREASSTNPPP